MLVLFSVVAIASCSNKSLSLLFDIPVEEPVTETAAQPVEPAPSAHVPVSDAIAETPPIEETLDWAVAQNVLPKDAFGGADWVAALRDGVVKPRALNPDDRLAESFKLDFFLENENPMFEAWFPHSVHTQWLGCQNCHAAIFPHRDNVMSMGEIFQGKYCGACHGKVAFPLTSCARCHRSM